MNIKIISKALKSNGEIIPVENKADAENTAAAIANGLFKKYMLKTGLAIMDHVINDDSIVYTFTPAVMLYKPVIITFQIIE